MKMLQKICFVLLLTTFSSVYGNCFQDEGIDNCLMKSQLGDSDSQFILGIMYYNGKGVVQDYKESAKWYRKAAEQGHSDSQLMLGSMYDDGKGVIQDYKESAKWYRKAAEQGHSSFINKRGHSAAQFILAGRYNDGKGVVQDYKESVKWYRKSAEQGYDDAQYNLGVMYYRGTHGVRKDYKESSKWYRKAAEQGHPKAQKFIQVFTKAAGQGNSDALEWMRKYEKEEEGRKNDQAIGVVFIVIFLVCLYFLPSIISFRRNHRNRWLIFLVNLVFGVTVLGWIGSLIWSLNKVDDPTKGGYKTDGQDGDHHF